VGRGDGQVKIRGYRVELGEVKAALMSHGSVREAAVVAREAEDGEKRLVAYVVGAEVEIGELRRLLRERLPEYMMPGWIVPLDKMPLTRNGKIDHRALPDPGEILDSETAPSAAGQPQTPYHEMLIDIWRQALGVSQVGIDDSFFDLGGHSLLATQLMSRVRKAFGVEVALRVLFDHSTVRSLGEVIEEAVRAGHGVAAPPLVPVERGRELPLSFAQQRLWFLDQLEPGNAFYNCPAAVRMRGRLDVGALKRTLQEIIRRHEALRTRFETANGQPVQVIEDAPILNLRVVDLKQLPESEREIEAQRIAREDACLPFDLRRCPLVRATLLNLADKEHVALFTMHHIVSDAWSKGVLVREVAALYEAFSQGRPSPLPELPIQYADYAVWQRNWLQGEVLEKQLAYWRERLGGKLQALELPTDRPRPARPRGEGAYHLFVLPDQLSESLKALCRRTGTTMFMVLLAAFQTLLQRYTDQDDIVIGANIANRARGETENLIGFFVNMMVMRADLSDNPTFMTLLGRVRETALSAYAYQDLPFAEGAGTIAVELLQSEVVTNLLVGRNSHAIALERFERLNQLRDSEYCV
jgi:acyl carrier protein